MKTRIIQTRFWDDEFVFNASKDTKLLYIYLLTSQYINISGIFQLDEKKIAFETGFTPKEFERAKEEIVSAGKVIFFKGWVKVVNAEKNNGYKNSPSNITAYERELSLIPQFVLDYFDTTPNSSEDSTVYSNHKSEIRNNKSKIINQKTEIVLEKKYTKREDITQTVIDELSEKYSCPTSFVLNCWDTAVNWLDAEGKTKKNYKAFLDNWVKRQIADDENLKLKHEPLNNSFRRTGGNVILEERE